MTAFQYILAVAYHAFKGKLELIKALENKTDADRQKIRALRRWMKFIELMYGGTEPVAQTESDDDDEEPPPGGGGTVPPPPIP